MTLKKINDAYISVLDLVPVNAGGNARESLLNSMELAQHVEELGYNRYWLAEHHNMPGIASSATVVIMGQIANATDRIRVGSGGIMLPNHAPLVVAEQIGTLESFFPDRIDLGLGRAPGTDQLTAFALRRHKQGGAESFPSDVEELQQYFSKTGTNHVRAIPGEGLDIPIWLLGSSDFSARLAAQKGMHFSFASHFAPAFTVPALQLYRNNFEPSDSLKKPYAMIGLNVIAADTDEKAEYLATSIQQQFLSLTRGRPDKLQPPVESMEHIWTPEEKAAVEQSLDPKATIVGSPETVKEKLVNFIEETDADEVIINSTIYNHEDRMRSYEIVAEIAD
ncbi:MAG TPA: LLM class flavin-dependent oxidoreductase [Bacillota bacterium]|nr:LLM class flavin-dependent oxidoreductase [Bacillota bacterium]